ncbi:CGNR zinc finger domain-containing protein [Nocardiopsis sp. LOL_012]|uniref:CGNR zinc finger domain-containing protein n=1 Tax=Nocardiopsis sp. LOL_012 TaxID=3345409 RepID=UPI003A8873AA
MTETAAAETYTAPPPAPGADRYPSLDFADSAIVLPGGHRVDLLGTPESATRWLVERGLAPEGARLWEFCAERLRSLRAPVRDLIATRVDGGPAPEEALAAVNEALTRVPTAPLLRWDAAEGPYRAVAHPATEVVDHALGILAADAADLLTSPDAERLAACGSSPCDRYLLRTHPRRHWCSVRCGDRARAARAYARRTRTGTD